VKAAAENGGGVAGGRGPSRGAGKACHNRAPR